MEQQLLEIVHWWQLGKNKIKKMEQFRAESQHSLWTCVSESVAESGKFDCIASSLEAGITWLQELYGDF